MARRHALLGALGIDDGQHFGVGLADALALPGQPRRMIFQHFSGVTQADLDLAKAQVLLAEHQGIVAALKTLRDAAAQTGRSDIVDHADPCLL